MDAVTNFKKILIQELTVNSVRCENMLKTGLTAIEIIEGVKVSHEKYIEIARTLAALEAENAKLREALKPFADAGADWMDKIHSDEIDICNDEFDLYLNLGQFRRAAATLSQIDKPKGTE